MTSGTILRVIPFTSQGHQKEKREQRIEKLFIEIMAENFPNLVKEIDTRAQKVQPVPTKMNPKRPTPRHIIIQVTKGKDKERILKEAREKQLTTYRETSIRLSADFLIETL